MDTVGRRGLEQKYAVVLLFSATLNEAVRDFSARIFNDPNQLFVDLALDSVNKYEAVCPEDQDNVDAFNCLPDLILCHILSFLPTKKAASTSVLSRRWRYLLASVPSLDFDDSIYLHPEKRGLTPWCLGPGKRLVLYINDKWSMRSTTFVDFVDRVLALHYDFTVNKFSLKTTDCYDPVDPDCVILWMHKVLALGVSDFHLVADWGRHMHFLLPSKIFSSKTLIRLSIKNVGQPSTVDVEDFHLPKLKTLYLESVLFGKEDIGFSKLLAGCKVLEELVLEGIRSYMWDSCSVTHATLKRLVFTSEQKAFHSPSSVSFGTPNLVYLEYSEVHARKYPKVNLESLIEAKIDLRMTREQERKAKSIAEARASELEAQGNEENDLFGDCTDFIKGVCNVQRLCLSGSTLEVLTFCCKAIPVFRNLTHLTIKSMRIFGWESLPCLLKSCPNLETLVFKGLLHRCRDACLCKSREEEDLVCLSTSPVKVVKILIDDGKVENHVDQVKHFLKTMPNLERLVLYHDSSFDQDLVIVSNQLEMVAGEASPPKCKVQVIAIVP